MPLLLLLAFIAVPLLELAVIDEVADAIGLWWTLALLLADSVVGAVLVRREGAKAWTSFRRALEQARWPGDEVVQGALVLVGGALLLTPGFVTDGVGLAFVLPPTRRGISAVVRRRFRRRGPFGSLSFGEFGRGGQGGTGPRGPGTATRSRPGDEPPEVEVMSVEREPPDGSSGDHDGSTP